MRAENDRMIFGECADELPDFDDLLWVQANRRFIQNNDIGETKHCSRKTGSLAVSFGKIADQAAGNIGKPDET